MLRVPERKETRQWAASGRRRRRVPVLVIALAALFIAAYAGVASLYLRVEAPQAPRWPADASAIHLLFTPHQVDTAGNHLVGDLGFVPGGTMVRDDGLATSADLDVLLASPGAQQTVTFRHDQATLPQPVTLHAAGAVRMWPFDTYRAHTMLLVTTPAPGQESGKRAVAAALAVSSDDVPGWEITISEDRTSGTMIAGTVVIHRYVIEARRSAATIAFGLVVLILMVMMPMLGLYVVILAYRGKRPVEIGFFTWIAGMLFATPMLRNFLPGNPPVGSLVDVLVVLWVLAALILALVIVVAAWHRWSRGGESTRLRRRTPT